MIKINERFKTERSSECWTLFDTQASEKSKTGVKTKRTYHTSLHQVVGAIFDRAPQGCSDLQEVVRRMEQIKSDVFRAIQGG